MQQGLVDAGEGEELGYLIAGSGPAVVLIHGAISSAEEMACALAPTFSGSFEVFALDRPGHGSSLPEGETGTCWAQAAVIRRACDRLGVRDPILIGHSFGGAVALAHALMFPEATKAVIALAPLVVPELRLEHFLFAPRSAPGVGRLLNLGAAGPDALIMPLLWRAMFLPQAPPAAFLDSFSFAAASDRPAQRANGQDAALLNLGLAQLVRGLPECRTPVRVFGGGGDLVVNNLLHGRLAAALVRDGDYVSLPGLGHMLHHFAQDEIFAAAQALQSPTELRKAS